MIQRLRLIHILFALILLTNFVAAWPWPPTMQSIEGLIFRRNAAADDNEGTLRPIILLPNDSLLTHHRIVWIVLIATYKDSGHQVEHRVRESLADQGLDG